MKWKDRCVYKTWMIIREPFFDGTKTIEMYAVRDELGEHIASDANLKKVVQQAQEFSVTHNRGLVQFVVGRPISQ